MQNNFQNSLSNNPVTMNDSNSNILIDFEDVAEMANVDAIAASIKSASDELADLGLEVLDPISVRTIETEAQIHRASSMSGSGRQDNGRQTLQSNLYLPSAPNAEEPIVSDNADEIASVHSSVSQPEVNTGKSANVSSYYSAGDLNVKMHQAPTLNPDMPVLQQAEWIALANIESHPNGEEGLRILERNLRLDPASRRSLLEVEDFLFKSHPHARLFYKYDDLTDWKPKIKDTELSLLFKHAHFEQLSDCRRFEHDCK